MTNELPKQLYIARFVLKCGVQFDVITELTQEEIDRKLWEHPKEQLLLIHGINPTKNWPVDLRVLSSEVAAFFHAPHEQWLGDRKVIS